MAFSHSVMSNILQFHGLQHTGFPVLQYLLEFTQTHVHWVENVIQPSHPLYYLWKTRSQSLQFSSVTQSCPTLCHPMNRSMPGLPVHHHLPEFTQIHIHQVGDAIQPSHPQSSPSPPAHNPSQHQSLFQWVNSSHEVTKVLELQLQHQSFQRTSRADLL